MSSSVCLLTTYLTSYLFIYLCLFLLSLSLSLFALMCFFPQPCFALSICAIAWVAPRPSDDRWKPRSCGCRLSISASPPHTGHMTFCCLLVQCGCWRLPLLLLLLLMLLLLPPPSQVLLSLLSSDIAAVAAMLAVVGGSWCWCICGCCAAFAVFWAGVAFAADCLRCCC